MKTKFFEFHQNNSGGDFVFEEAEGITHNVIIEARDGEHANSIAEGIGLYWNGCEDGRDCECCGDRWYPVWSEKDGYDTPTLYGQPVEKAASTSSWMPPGKETCVHYLDGTKKWFGVRKQTLDELKAEWSRDS